MPKRALNIVSTAYRATLEEQDDTVLWLLHTMRAAGADLDVVLQDNAVNYAARGQDASGLSVGGRRQTHPPRLDEDVSRLAGTGVQVFVVEDDLAERGLDRSDLVDGVTTIARKEIAPLCARYAYVWRW